MQSEVVTTRDCVPARVHGSSNAHAVQSPVTKAAHEVPSVDARVHARMFAVLVGWHAPLTHAYVVEVCVCIPLVVQRSVPKSHVLHAPIVGAGQSASVAQPVHVLVIASQWDAPGHGLTPS